MEQLPKPEARGSPPIPREPTISLVVTSFEQRDHLRETLASVRAQSHAPHQVVVADDASEDESDALIRAWCRDDPGVAECLFQTSNLGIPRNRNAALERVTGSHVAIIDGDDVLHPEFVQRHAEALRSAPAGACSYSNWEYVDERLGRPRPKFQGRQPSGDVLLWVAEARMGLLRSFVVPVGEVRRAGLLDPRFPKHDGYVLTLRAARNCPFVYVDRPLLLKRQHERGDSRSIEPMSRLAYLEAVREEVLRCVSDQPADAVAAVREVWRRRLDALRRRIQGSREESALRLDGAATRG